MSQVGEPCVRPLTELYRPSLALLTDLYQLTMAYAYWKSGVAEREAVFHLSFRHNPFGGGFALACGLAYVIDFIQRFRLDESDIAYLAGLEGNDGRPLFERAFLDFLGRLRLSCDLDAVPEGTVVFAHEPLVRVQGPIIACQLLETPLLNLVNFHTLIATKAARVCHAAGDDSVLEFGLRRAQGVDGALAASRATYVGGCAATSNVLAGKLFGIPVSGTHAHSWVMLFDTELEAFQAYAAAMPNNCVFLVDTYDTLAGVRHAIEAGRRLRERGHAMIGIRLDSGDLAYLSIEARRMLDDAGFPDAVIVASNDLDEHLIQSLKQQGAAIGVWGVGTKLVTGHDQPALGGVYKLTAVRAPGEPWQYRLKLSEQTIKISTPGVLQVRRYYDDSGFIADAIFDIHNGMASGLRPTRGSAATRNRPARRPAATCCTIVDPLDATRRKRISDGTPFVDLLVPIFRSGKLVYESPALREIQQTARDQLTRFHAGIKRFVNPHQYPVGVEARLHQLKTDLVLRARQYADRRSQPNPSRE